MKRERIFLSTAIVVFAVLFVTHPVVLGYLTSRLAAVSASPLESPADLKVENQRLKSDLARFSDIRSELPRWSPDHLRAEVYARYPFSVKNELLVSAGASDGVLSGMGVVVNELLLGSVENVFQHTALVRTIFDERWQSAARIGGQGIEALFAGGAEPKLTLIMKGANVNPGDIVYNSAPQFPIGLPIGEVKSIGLSADGVFQEAGVLFAYDVNRLRAVSILVNHAGPEKK